MRKLICFFLLTAFGLHASATRTVTVFVRNQLDNARTDQPVVISLAQYGEVRSALVTVDGQEIPCQLDDLNQDDIFDELCFLANLGPSSTKASHAPTLPASMPTCWSGTPATRN